MAFHSRLFPQVDGSDTDPVGIMGTVFGDGEKDGACGGTKEAADGALHRLVEFEWEGLLFTVTDRDEVAEVVEDGEPQVLGSESYVEAETGTRQHFVDVPGDREAMLLFVSVREDERRIVSIWRFS